MLPKTEDLLKFKLNPVTLIEFISKVNIMCSSNILVTYCM